MKLCSLGAAAVAALAGLLPPAGSAAAEYVVKLDDVSPKLVEVTGLNGRYDSASGRSFVAEVFLDVKLRAGDTASVKLWIEMSAPGDYLLGRVKQSFADHAVIRRYGSGKGPLWIYESRWIYTTVVLELPKPVARAYATGLCNAQVERLARKGRSYEDIHSRDHDIDVRVDLGVRYSYSGADPDPDPHPGMEQEPLSGSYTIRCKALDPPALPAAGSAD
ncbi:hypothetical protein [Pelagibius sp.]|uniref:hypothetical protein n=1 Tax=Pelagibius sp. TaxID=1931238 RepID=UPI0026271E73|nr:hypothetical protein [Pelagibius sp.]